MKAQCSICTELFHGEATISALPCGHTFHAECVNRWLYQSRTCPQCRNACKPDRIIHHLYFDQSDANENTDPSQLQNELDSARAALRQKNKEKGELMKTMQTLQDTIGTLTSALASVKSDVKQERTANVSLRNELKFHKKLQTRAEASVTEANSLQKKLTQLQSIADIIKGSETDVQSMIALQGNDVRQLATWCVVLQKELTTKRLECRTLRDNLHQLKKEHFVNCRTLADGARELTSAKEQLKNSEDDLLHAEASIRSLQKKTEALQKAIASPTATASSFAHRLINESPAPMPVRKRPKLSAPGNDLSELDVSSDLFPDTESKLSPPVKDAAHMTQSIKISSAAGTKKPHRNMHDVSNMAGYNLFKKKPVGGNSVLSAIRKGYNGLGGHEKFVQPLGHAKTLMMLKQQASAGTSSKHGKLFSDKPPLLPTMSKFGLPHILK